MTHTAAILVVAAAGLAVGQPPADPLAGTGLRATPGAKPIQLDFDGDGKRELAIVATVLDPNARVAVDNPWARSVGEKIGGPLRRGERVLAITDPRGKRWVLRDAVYDMAVPLQSGHRISRYRDCWRDERREALFVGTEDAGGILAWSGGRFNWIQCGD